MADEAKAPLEAFERQCGSSMSRMNYLLPMAVMAGLIASAATASAETGRIKRKPPTDLEAERIASEMAMSDGLLQKGDIVVTARGFFVFRGLAADGFSYDFAPVPNPLPSSKK